MKNLSKMIEFYHFYDRFPIAASTKILLIRSTIIELIELVERYEIIYIVYSHNIDSTYTTLLIL